MDLARIRKAIVAGVGAAVTTVVTAVQTDGLPDTPEGWAGLVAAALGAAIVLGVATYSVRNEGTVNGSDPVGGPRVGPPV